MPITYSILSDRDLAVVIYEGDISADERAEVIGEVIRHRSFRPDQMHLVDLSGVTSWEDEIAQAVKSGEVLQDWQHHDRQTLCVYYAPTDTARDLAEVLARAWDGVPGVVPLVLDDEAEALAILGQTEMRVSELSQAA